MFCFSFCRKRKSLYSGHDLRPTPSVPNGSTMGPTMHHQLTLHKVGDQLRHHLSAASGMASTLKPQCHIPADLLVTSTGDIVGHQVIHARTACGCGNNNGICTNQQAIASGSSSTLSNFGTMPNHYIPEGMQPKMILVNSDMKRPSGTATLDPLSQRKHMNDFRTRLEPPVSRNVMTLSDRPPMVAPTNITQFPPHILIGGQPFYLVPNPSGNPEQQPSMQDNYSYPQNIMPIYEEIDGNTSSQRIYAGSAAVSTSDFEYNYCNNGEVQGPFMTSEKKQHPLQVNPSDIMMSNLRGNKPRQTGSSSSLGAERPASSSASNSQHTNSSEISSCNSDDQGSQNQQAQTHHVLVNPFPPNHLDVTDEIKRFHNDNSFSSDYVNSSTESGQHKLHNITSSGVSSSASYKYPPRLADGFERSRSPQSIYSAKLAFKQRPSPSSPSCSSSGNSSGGKSNSSVYYYSDTLRKPQDPQNKLYQNETEVKASKGSPSKLLTTSDESDSGIGNRFELSPMSQQKSTVNTRVVLDESTSKKSALV